jgi:hypothetical protein
VGVERGEETPPEHAAPLAVAVEEAGAVLGREAEALRDGAADHRAAQRGALQHVKAAQPLRRAPRGRDRRRRGRGRERRAEPPQILGQPARLDQPFADVRERPRPVQPRERRLQRRVAGVEGDEQCPVAVELLQAAGRADALLQAGVERGRGGPEFGADRRRAAGGRPHVSRSERRKLARIGSMM